MKPTIQKLWWLPLLLLLALGAASVVAYRTWWRPTIVLQPLPPPAPAGPPADPRLTYTGPFRNVHPDVRYLGDAACTNCHFDVALKFQHHPMGRSLTPIAELAPRQVYDAERHNPFEALGLHFKVERQGDRVVHREKRLDDQGRPIYEREVEAHYAIGSGARGHSYITNHEGYLFQTPVSWFGQKKIWDLSPGFKLRHVTSRPVGGECLYCHANQTLFQEGSLNRFERPVFLGHAIGCERCHGPGGKHVETMDPLDIVNPRRLEPELREAVCQQCHLEGAVRVLPRGRQVYDFRPGLPLESCWTVLARADAEESRRAVNHVEQMHQSVCFQKSAGAKKLGCISCHDPHEKPEAAQRVQYFRQRCLECHGEHGCTAPAAAREKHSDSCMTCHMPSYGSSDIAHTASTDHRIVRTKDGAERPASHKKLWPDLPVTPFHPRAQADDFELRRDLGLGLVMLMAQGKIEPTLYINRALGLLEAATQRDPKDYEAWRARGEALTLRNQHWPALTAFETALEHRPNHELARTAAAAAAQSLGEDDRALKHWREAVKLNPWMPVYRVNFAAVLARQGLWPEVVKECEAWVKLDPGDAEARVLLVQALIHTGNHARAKSEFVTVEALRPANLDQFKKWFEGKVKS